MLSQPCSFVLKRVIHLNRLYPRRFFGLLTQLSFTTSQTIFLLRIRPFRGPISNNFSWQQPLPICWHCGKTVRQRVDRVLCVHCRRIQPLPPHIDYFAYLGFDDPNFTIDSKELKKRFWQMQSLVHPDKFAGRDEYEVKLSEQHSTFLNNAYRTLKDPFSRAEYLLTLLERLKEDVSESVKVYDLDEEGVVEDTEVAAEMMELMESIEQLPENSPEIQSRIDRLDTELYQLLCQVHELTIARRLAEARQALRRISYLRRSRRILESKLSKNKTGRWGGEHDD